MEYINTKKKQRGTHFSPVAGGSLIGGGTVTRPVQPVAGVQSAPKAAQPNTAQSSGSYSSTTYRPGVSQQTSQALAGYESGYTPGDAVQQAQAYLEQIMGQRPGEYQSPYQQQLEDLFAQIQGRKPFTYDLNADMLYQQYRDQYQNLGRQAMMDTMGQAAGLTGGYGSSYSQNAGQQAYQGYLQQLNDRVPELYRLAMEKYQMEGDDLLRQYGLVNDRENQAYGRYRDTVGDWRADVDRAENRYNTERGWDYGQWSDMRDYWLNKANQENSDYWTQTQWDYQKERDAVADAQWQKEFDAQQAYRAAQARASSAAYDDLLRQYNELLAKQHPSMNPNAYTEPGVYQGEVEIPGYGTVNNAQYKAMLRAGLLDEMMRDKNGTYYARMKNGYRNFNPFNMIK
jgi:hypothetical protein